MVRAQLGGLRGVDALRRPTPAWTPATPVARPARARRSPRSRGGARSSCPQLYPRLPTDRRRARDFARRSHHDSVTGAPARACPALAPLDPHPGDAGVVRGGGAGPPRPPAHRRARMAAVERSPAATSTSAPQAPPPACSSRRRDVLVSLGVNRVVDEACSCAHAETMALAFAQAALGNVGPRGAGAPGPPARRQLAPVRDVLRLALWSGVVELVIAGEGAVVEQITGFDEGPIHPAWRDEPRRTGHRPAGRRRPRRRRRHLRGLPRLRRAGLQRARRRACWPAG